MFATHNLSHYICRHSAKLSYLASLTHTICVENRRKLIVFCDWPATAWLVEVLLTTIGFNVLRDFKEKVAKEKLKDTKQVPASSQTSETEDDTEIVLSVELDIEKRLDGVVL